MVNPLPGEKVTAHFGHAKHPLKKGEYRHHNGIDVKAGDGQVVAPADGVVERATTSWQGHEAWGTVVVLDHGSGVKTFYAHLDSMDVKVGDRVRRGQAIATPGNTGQSTGPHLHFEIRVDDQWVDPAMVIADWR